jgi:hypothetical protein
MNTCSCSPYVTSSLTRGRVCRLQMLLVLASAVRGSEFLGTHGLMLLSQIRDSPNLEGQAPLFISPRNRVAQLYPQALGSFFVTSYDSQSYGGGIRTRLHTGREVVTCLPLMSQRPHRKRRLQQFFAAAWKSLPSCLVTTGEPTDRQDWSKGFMK